MSSTKPAVGTAHRVLSARHLVFFVIAAAAPLGFSVGAIPLAIGRGGIGVVGAFLVMGLMLGVFAIGYVRMARHLESPGGLYAFVAAGLGRSAGVGASYVALLVYTVAATGAVGAFAVFADAAANDVAGLDLSWGVYAAACVIAMGVLGALQVDVSAKVLGVIITLEIGMLALVSGSIFVQGGAAGVSASPLAVDQVFTHSSGVMFALAISAFAGFEATVIYSGEVRDRQRTIRRATVAALTILALLYAITSWALITAYGASDAVAAANADPVYLFFTATHAYLGSWAVKLVELLVVSSWFASVLAFHNAAARYLAAMGQDGVVPAVLGRLHPRWGSPVNASALHTSFTVVVVSIALAAQADPYLDLYVLGSGPAVLGIPVLEFLASLGIVAFFARSRRGHSPASTVIAPVLASGALGLVVVLIVTQMSLLTARTGWINAVIVCSVALALVVGTLRGVVLGRRASTRVVGDVEPVA
jgi:amino acid transporter